MGYYRSAGGERVRAGVVLPDWDQRVPGLADAVAAGEVYDIEPDRPREAVVAGAIMTVGRDPVVETTDLVVIGAAATE